MTDTTDLIVLAEHEEDVHWTVTTAASLYWRVKGDAANAIKCLRHSLNSSPQEMRVRHLYLPALTLMQCFQDVAMVSLASIYLQAGFVHSALVVGGEALKISPDSVVAIHFTLANIYAAMVRSVPKLLQTNSPFFAGRLSTRIEVLLQHGGIAVEFPTGQGSDSSYLLPI